MAAGTTAVAAVVATAAAGTAAVAAVAAVAAAAAVAAESAATAAVAMVAAGTVAVAAMAAVAADAAGTAAVAAAAAVGEAAEAVAAEIAGAAVAVAAMTTITAVNTPSARLHFIRFPAAAFAGRRRVTSSPKTFTLTRPPGTVPSGSVNWAFWPWINRGSPGLVLPPTANLWPLKYCGLKSSLAGLPPKYCSQAAVRLARLR
mmetsp:Transcript_7284/g.23226  ORF Transcript_7284/g.23226 Transcript_7284/m.23226 type:complete len:202 (+) Transcript_7284:267-872(+)